MAPLDRRAALPRELVPAPVTFTEDWFGEASCEALARLYKLTDAVEGHVIEVGCWQGRSTIALATAAKNHTVYAVDTWYGSPGEISADLASQRDVFAEFTANTAHLPNIEVRRMGWREFFADLTGPVRFLHIDAEHT